MTPLLLLHGRVPHETTIFIADWVDRP